MLNSYVTDSMFCDSVMKVRKTESLKGCEQWERQIGKQLKFIFYVDW